MSKNFTLTPLYVNVCLVLLLVSPSFAQSPCDDTQVTLSTQEEVNNFPSQYCSTLCSLTITGNDITNLDSLYVLRRVGSLSISYNPVLVDIDGLSNITELKSTCFSKGLTVEGNNLLGQLAGLSSLTKVSGPIIIRSNTMLQDLDGLSNVDSVGVGDSGNGGWLSIAIGN